MAEVYADERVRVEMLGPLGSFGNNAYIVRPANGGPALVVDAPEGAEEVARALGGQTVSAIVITHGHRDHWAGLEALRRQVEAPVYMGAEPRIAEVDPARGVEQIDKGFALRVGEATVEVIETPGHTPGSICLRLGRVVLTGDTLFPGGPGRTASPADLAQEIASIRAKLHPLPAETLVLPGHGATTTIGASRAEYEVFAAREHPADLAGDVLWLES